MILIHLGIMSMSFVHWYKSMLIFLKLKSKCKYTLLLSESPAFKTLLKTCQRQALKVKKQSGPFRV